MVIIIVIEVEIKVMVARISTNSLLFYKTLEGEPTISPL